MLVQPAGYTTVMAILNLWKNIHLICHADGSEMILDKKCNYTCQKCRNHISINDFEKMLSCLEKQIIEGERSGIAEDLAGYKFTNRKRDIRYVVTEYDRHKHVMTVSANNLLAKK